MGTHSAASQFSQPSVPPRACKVCGNVILWRRWLAANWDKVVYCSASCRRTDAAQGKNALEESSGGFPSRTTGL